MFHEVGLTARYENSQLRFEVAGANAARDFLRGHGIPKAISRRLERRRSPHNA